MGVSTIRPSSGSHSHGRRSRGLSNEQVNSMSSSVFRRIPVSCSSCSTMTFLRCPSGCGCSTSVLLLSGLHKSQRVCCQLRWKLLHHSTSTALLLAPPVKQMIGSLHGARSLVPVCRLHTLLTMHD